MNFITDPNEMIDLVLKWFAMDTREIVSKRPAVTREFVSFDDAAKSGIDFFPQLNNTEYLMHYRPIFEKLVKDGYIKKEYDLYSITFEGKMFSKAGGYAEQLRKYEYKKWLEEKLYKTTIDSNVSVHSVNRLFWATLAIALFGAIAPWLDYAKNTEIKALKKQIKELQDQLPQKQLPQFFPKAKQP
jgi:hypothetical protein